MKQNFATHRILTLFAIFVIILLSASCEADNPKSASPASGTPSASVASSFAILNVSGEQVKIYYGEHIIYVIGQNPISAEMNKNYPDLNYLFKTQLPVEFGVDWQSAITSARLMGKQQRLFFPLMTQR